MLRDRSESIDEYESQHCTPQCDVSIKSQEMMNGRQSLYTLVDKMNAMYLRYDLRLLIRVNAIYVTFYTLKESLQVSHCKRNLLNR